LSRLRLIAGVAACDLFWAFFGAVLGALFRHPLGGFVCGLSFGVAYIVSCSWASDKYPGDVWGAALLENVNAPHLYEMLHTLCDRTGQALPTLYYIPRPEPNAFASAGRDGETTVIVTSGLTRHLEKDEVQAALALMTARLATGAMPGWTFAATLAGVPVQVGLTLQRRSGLGWLGTAILSVFVYPAAALMRLVWDEGVVTAADYHAAHLAEQAGSLAGALAKMEAWLIEEGGESNNPATALLFAVPPLPPLAANAPFWRRGLEQFPFRQPDAAVRAARFAEVVPAPVPAAPAEEFPF